MSSTIIYVEEQNVTEHEQKSDSGALTQSQAETVWAILEEVCGARSDHGFVHHQTRGPVTEWRFMGTLGFGGKFWRHTAKRPDGSWGELWRVDCYREDETPERLAALEQANQRLWDVQCQITTPAETGD